MQTITTKYVCSAQGQGRVSVITQYGNKRVLWDDALNSEQNHRAAVEKVIAGINADRGLRFRIVNSAPLPNSSGWCFMIDRVPEVAPQQMSITVKFCPATNSGPAFMRAYSWLFPRGIKVNYSPRVADGSSIQENARYAAGIMLDQINESCKEHGDMRGYKLADYVQLYNDDRLFVLIPG